MLTSYVDNGRFFLVVQRLMWSLHAAGQPAPKKLTAAESRSLAWLVWAREILRLPTSGIRWETDALGAAARGLAAQTPYVVRLKDISVEVTRSPLDFQAGLNV